MNIKTLEYAQLNLDAIANESRFTTFVSQDNLYIQFPNGRNLKLADDEVKYQAEEYLKSEINLLQF